MSSARWLMKPDPGPVVGQIEEKFGVSRILATILAQRVNPPTLEKVEAFLRPTLNTLVSPWELDGMDIAAERLAKAVRERQRVIVFGDYDTDGVTASALMIRACRAAGFTLEYRLPSRFEEGYGISTEFAANARNEKIDLIITVDCGTSEHENIKLMSESGVDVIVTDHHEPGDRELPPEALAIVNPKRADSKYPFRELTGVGVAFKLAWAMCEKLSGQPKVDPHLREALLSLLPLAAIGTIADVAPLTDENRSIVAAGLRTMHNACPGIAALMELCRLNQPVINTRNVAFSISPRINAAGRMGNADLALELLIEDDPAKAREYAQQLDRLNSERQTLCQVILEEAADEVRRTHDLDKVPAVMVARDGWHEGVIGIVAGRLAEIFGRPAAVITFPDGHDKGRGSARSANGLNLYQAIANSRQHLLTFGGHELAAGFTVDKEHVDMLRKSFLRECGSQVRTKNISPSIEIDMAISLSDINIRLIEEIDRLRPMGQGNPEPKFLIAGVHAVGSAQLMGQAKSSFCFNVAQGGSAYRAVVFNNIRLLTLLEEAGRRPLDIIATPNLNTHYTPARLELRVDDIRISGS